MAPILARNVEEKAMLKRIAVMAIGMMVLAGVMLSGCEMPPKVTIPEEVASDFENDYAKGTWLQEQAAAYAQQGKDVHAELYYQEAIYTFEQYKMERASKSPLLALTNLRIGESYEALGRFEEAMKAYDEVIDTTPSDPAREFAEKNKENLQKKMDQMKEDAEKAAEEMTEKAEEATEEAAGSETKEATEEKPMTEQPAAE